MSRNNTMGRALRCAIVVAALSGAECVVAQSAISTAAGRIAVSGIAFDSLRGTPLVGATLSLSGLGLNATSDASGRFQFDGVQPGAYTLTMYHAALDSLGVSGISIPWVIRTERDVARIAIPSFARFWHAACGALPVPVDSGFLFGSVADARSGVPIAGATIALSFVDLGFSRGAGVRQRRWSGKVETDATGSYTVCGLPSDVAVQLVANKDSSTTDTLTLEPVRVRVQRRDLLIGRAQHGDSAMVGVVSGRVVGAEGAPVKSAHLTSPLIPETLSADDGTFVIRGLPVGTRAITVSAIGAAPVTRIVNVTPHDTARIDVRLEKATVLDKVKVTATSIRQRRIDDMEHRRALGIGHFLDSTRMAAHTNIGSALTEIPFATFPCAVYIDGIKQQKFGPRDLRLVNPAEIAVLEFHRGPTTPMEYTQKGDCPVLLMWTKLGLP